MSGSLPPLQPNPPSWESLLPHSPWPKTWMVLECFVSIPVFCQAPALREHGRCSVFDPHVLSYWSTALTACPNFSESYRPHMALTDFPVVKGILSILPVPRVCPSLFPAKERVSSPPLRGLFSQSLQAPSLWPFPQCL